MTWDPSTHVYTVKEIDLIRECVRKWACKYVLNAYDPKHANAQDGIDMHAILQAMVKHGPQANTAPESKVGRWARKLYPMTPAGCHTEVSQTFVLPCGTRRGSFKIDFILPGFAAFGDWKSCAGPKWSVTDLSTDLQANLEAYGFCQVFRREYADLTWLYVDKKTEQSWSVPGRITYAQAGAWLQTNAMPWVRLIEALRSVPGTPQAAAYPHNIVACDGEARRCSFLGHCQFQDAPAGVTTERLLQLTK